VTISTLKPLTADETDVNSDRWATLVGFFGALAVLAGLVWLSGVDRVLDALLAIQKRYLVVIFGVAVVWLVSWGMALRTVLSALGQSISRRLATLVFAAAVFSNNVTPFGQAGGEPVSGYLISEAADSDYETGLAAIASVDALHFVPSIGVAIAGLTFVIAGAVQLGRNLIFAVVATVGLAAGIPVAAYLGWRYRYELEAVVVRVVTPIVRTIGRVVPRKQPPSAGDIEERIERFFGAIDRVASDRRTLLEAITFSAVGWVALCASLWLSLIALGYRVPFAVVLVVVPMGAIASITPLPGGLGGIETVQVALLVSVTTVLVSTSTLPQGVATSAVLVHRTATYLLPTVVGGGTAVSLGITDR
jgi:uncharacterized protein (TIRG00374 family)